MREQSYEEFRLDVCKARGPHKMKVVNSWGSYRAYKYIKKNHWFDIGRPITEHEFHSIVRNVNKLFAENILNGITVTFPSKMGRLELTKIKKGAFFKDGKLKVTYPINWTETLKLWYTDEEARQEKILVRFDSETVYMVHYNRYNATYSNKSFYQFTLNRAIKRGLKDKIINGEIDTIYGD